MTHRAEDHREDQSSRTRSLGLTPSEWRALVYFHRVDELAQFAPRTDLRSVIQQFELSDDHQVRSAIAVLAGTLFTTEGLFAEAQHWFEVAVAEAPRSTWVSARANAFYANQLLWNGDVALAGVLIDEAQPIDHPLSDFAMRVVRARIAFARRDFELVTDLAGGLVGDDIGDPLALGEGYAAVFVASIALAENRLADAEVAIRRALLISTPDTRSNAILIERLGRVMARCGLIAETDACRRMAHRGLARWPSEASGSTRGFELLMAALGLKPRASPHVGAGAWPPAAGDTGRRIIALGDEADAHLGRGDRASARDSIADLVSVMAEHTKVFESIEARTVATNSLAPFPSLAVGLGRLGDPGDAMRITRAAMRILITDQSRGEPAIRFADQLRPLLDWATSADIGAINQLELIDLDFRIRRLDIRRQPSRSSLPATGWLDEPLPEGELLLFAEADEHLWRFMSHRDVLTMDDLGPVAEIERAVRSFRLAAAALGLDHPDAERRLADAAAVVESMLLGDHSWDADEPLVMLPSRSLPGLPWRLLPALRRPRLEIALGHATDNDRVQTRRRVALINGPGLGVHERSDGDGIVDCYSASSIADEPALTPGRLAELCRSTDVVHIAGHGRLERVRLRLAQTFEERLAEVPTESSAGDIAQVVVFGSSDLSLREPGRHGLAWLLLGHGVQHVIASTIDLDPNETTVLMPQLHRLLAEGIDPASALHQLAFEDPRVQAAADSLVCLSHDPSR